MAWALTGRGDGADMAPPRRHVATYGDISFAATGGRSRGRRDLRDRGDGMN